MRSWVKKWPRLFGLSLGVFHRCGAGGGVRTPPKTKECPLKRDYFNRKCIFQPVIFRGHSLVFRCFSDEGVDWLFWFWRRVIIVRESCDAKNSYVDMSCCCVGFGGIFYFEFLVLEFSRKTFCSLVIFFYYPCRAIGSWICLKCTAFELCRVPIDTPGH